MSKPTCAEVNGAMEPTINPKAIRRYFQPMFCDATSHVAGGGGHELLGMRSSPITAARTAPNEKNTDSAVTRYCFPFGMCSRRRVPSVGIEPYNV